MTSLLLIDVMTLTPNVLISSDVSWEDLLREDESCVRCQWFSMFTNISDSSLDGGQLQFARDRVSRLWLPRSLPLPPQTSSKEVSEGLEDAESVPDCSSR